MPLVPTNGWLTYLAFSIPVHTGFCICIKLAYGNSPLAVISNMTVLNFVYL